MRIHFTGIAGAGMSAAALHDFVESPYNRLADVKMGLFFSEMTAVGAWVMFVLAALSLLYKGFWCRYLCPYGALLGLTSWLSPTRPQSRALRSRSHEGTQDHRWHRSARR